MTRPILVTLAACFVCGLASGEAQVVPQIINYQGRIAANGVNFDGNGIFKFALINGTGGASLWSNDNSSVNGSEPSASVQVAVARGLYSVLLGDTSISGMVAIPPAIFLNPDVRLRIWFNDGTHGFEQLGPDQRLASVPYAMIAATVPDGSITPAKLATGAVLTGLGVGTVTGFLGCSPPTPEDVTVFIPGESIQSTLGTPTASGYPYRLSNVPAGTPTVTVRLANGSRVSQQVTVTAGATQTLDFPLLVKSYTDADGDGYGNATTERSDCVPPVGNVINSLDFNDNCGTCYPGAPELCDNKDNDNNGQTDDGVSGVGVACDGPDSDGCQEGVTVCAGVAGIICNDNTGNSVEICNGNDDDCDGNIDEDPTNGITYYRDADSDNFGNPNDSVIACSPPPGYVTNNGDCNDANFTIHPGATETCNNADDDCDGQMDEGFNLFTDTLNCGACGTVCGPGQACNAGQCKSPLGVACSSNFNCQSNSCVDGVCCNSSCSGTCMKCNLAPSVGICSNVPLGQDPDNECAGSANCNGAAACGP